MSTLAVVPLRSMGFFVPGIPAQQGNHRTNQYGATYETSKNHAPWRDSIIYAAKEARAKEADDGIVFAGPVAAELTFIFPRPKNHYGTGRNAGVLKPDAAYYKTSAPDLDKLIRATLDAITVAGIWRDDAQVVMLGGGGKVYTQPNGINDPGLVVSIRSLA
jgi:Holliday junction resolvase RusA-like endonuclease